MRLTSPYDNHVWLNSGKHGLAAPILHSTQLAHFIPGFVKIFGLFPDFFSKQKFLFPEPCLTIPLPAALASPPLSYHPYQLPSIPFPLPYHTLCLRMTIPLPLHCHPPTSCLTIPLWHTLLSPSRALPSLTCTLYPFPHALLHPTSMLYSIFTPCFTIVYSFILPTLSLCLTTPFFFALLSPTPPSYTTVLTSYLDSFVIWCCQKWLAITREVHTSYSCCVSLEHSTFSFTLDNEKVSQS